MSVEGLTFGTEIESGDSLYGVGVDYTQDGASSVTITTEPADSAAPDPAAAPPSTAETLLEEVKPYAAPVGLALLLLIVGAALMGGGKGGAK